MRFTVGKKLYIGFGTLLVLMLLLGGLGMYKLGVMNHKTTEITTTWLPAVESVNNINYMMEHVRALELNFMMEPNHIEFEALNQEVKKTYDAIDKEFAKYETTITLEDDRKYFTALKNEWKNYRSLHDKFYDLAKKINIFDGAKDLGPELLSLLYESKTSFSIMQNHLEKLVKINHEGAVRAAEAGDMAFNESIRDTLLVIALSVLVSGVFAFILVRGISRPLHAITDNVKKIAEGDLRVQEVVVKNKDEIGQLAASFNAMVTNLRFIVDSVRKSAIELSANSSEMAASAEEITSTVEDVANNMHSVAQEAQKGNEVVAESSKVMLELSSLIQTAKSKAVSAADNSKLTLEAAAKGRETISQTVASMKNIQDKTVEAKRQIEKLDQYSQEIGLITTTITNLANQTNLLALNAAIEAARAGEAGRGFAVVADEVRKLAEQSTQGAAEVAALVAKILENTSTVVEVTEQSRLEVDKGVSSVNLAGEALENILSAVNHSVTDITDIVQVTDDEVASSEKIVEIIQYLAQTIEKMSDNAQYVAASTEEMIASMETIAASTEESSGVATELEIQVDKFKL